MNDDIDFLILWYLFHQKKSRKHSRYKKAFYKRLSSYQRRIRSRRIPRASLLHPKVSAWRKLFESRNDQSFVTLTGLDVRAFDNLVPVFEEFYVSTSPTPDVNGEYRRIDPARGRNRFLKAEDCLGLVLVWTRTRGSLYILQLTFGISYTTTMDYVKFGIRILLKTLYGEKAANVEIPPVEKISEYMECIESRHPHLKNVWCTMDGLKLAIEAASSFEVQGRYFNGWIHGHFIGAIIVFCPDGTIPIVAYNCPGSVHDAHIAEWGDVYEKLESVYGRCGGKCTVDSATVAGKPLLCTSMRSIASCRNCL